MDILIKGLEMPSCCGSCPFLYSHYGNMGCRFVGRVEEIFSPNRPKDCPLIPVPEHGDLIERDAVLNELKKYYKVGEVAEVGEVACFIDEAEVVLERTT